MRADQTTGNGGGTAIIIHDFIPFAPVRQSQATPYEAVFIKIFNLSLYIGAVYNLPRSTLSSSDLNVITGAGTPFVVGGDFNARHRTWNNCSNNGSGNALFQHALGETYRIVHPDNFTFCGNPGCNPSILDIFLVNCHRAFLCEITDDFNTRHRLVVLKATQGTIHPPGWVRLTNCEMYGRVTKDIRLRSSFSSPQDIDSCIQQLDGFLKSGLRRSSSFIPSKSIRDFSLDPRLSSYIRQRRGARRAWQRTGLQYFCHIAKCLTTKINCRLRSLRRADCGDRLKSLNKANPTFWSNYKQLTLSSTVIPPLCVGEALLSADDDKAEAFTGVHSRVLRLTSLHAVIVDVFVHRLDEHSCPSPLMEYNITLEQIREAIGRLQVKKAPGGDGISAIMLKSASSKVWLQLYYIFRSSLIYSYFPVAWKIAKVSPIPKPGKPKSSVDGYRPISLLPVIGKVFERCIHWRMVEHLEGSGILLNHQFGFRPGHSTLHQLVRVAQLVAHELNVNRSAAMVLLDLSRAFDSDWHEALLFKLDGTGFAWTLVKLIRSYLTDRSIYVSVKGNNSSRHPVSAGVLQGSILGPLLFNIFINDILIVNDFFLALYADDTSLISSSWQDKLLVLRLQIYLDKVIEYFKDWKLTVNPAKTQPIFFNRWKPAASGLRLSVDGVDIIWSHEVRYLGLMLDKGLTMGPAVMDRVQRRGLP